MDIHKILNGKFDIIIDKFNPYIIILTAKFNGTEIPGSFISPDIEHPGRFKKYYPFPLDLDCPGSICFVICNPKFKPFELAGNNVPIVENDRIDLLPLAGDGKKADCD
jgi:hypothetical protein